MERAAFHVAMAAFKFYQRVHALLRPDEIVLDFGAEARPTNQDPSLSQDLPKGPSRALPRLDH
jgi:hypothetical protein